MVVSGARAGRKLDDNVRHAIDVCQSRLTFVLVVFFIGFTALGLRIANLAMTSGADEVEDIREKRLASEARVSRSNIFDRNGVILATNLKTASLYANPKQILDSKEAAEKLVKLFPELNKENLKKQLSDTNKGFIWIKRNLNPKEHEMVMNLGLPGLEFTDEEKRVYPHGNLLAHILGMVGVDGHGLSGLERQYDEKLNSKDDENLQLTIDVRIQDILHKELYNKYKAHSAKAAAGLIMDVNTGEILALASLPDFDPNNPNVADKDAMFNNATLGLYEMGSTFKTFTLAMALDSGIIDLNDSFDATQPIKVGRFYIHDYHPENRWLSTAEVFMHSSNIGTALIADKIGAEKQKSYLKKLGLLEPLSFEIPEKSSPLYPSNWSRISTMTIGYGHGISVTLAHVATSISSVINGGILYTPTVIKNEKHSEGVKVFKKSTSDTMRKLLRLVVEKGTGEKANAEGYLVGGKTGTAEKAGGKKYDKKKLISSFVGVFPMDKPRYAVVVMLDEPQGTKETFGFATAGWTAAPIVKNIVEHIAPILGVRPAEDGIHVKEAMHIEYDGHGGDDEAL